MSQINENYLDNRYADLNDLCKDIKAGILGWIIPEICITHEVNIYSNESIENVQIQLKNLIVESERLNIVFDYKIIENNPSLQYLYEIGHMRRGIIDNAEGIFLNLILHTF